jgi:hypothetical protein
MVFIPQRLLQEKLWLEEVKATVDPKAARSIYFRRQAILEEGTGEPCWLERGYVYFLCAVAAFLAFASAYYALAQHNPIAVAVVGITVFGAIRLESLALRYLKWLLYFSLIGGAAVVATIEPAWPKLLTGAIFVYFLSFAYAAKVTFLMMMRNDRAYRALYPALRIHFPDNR